MKVSCPGCDHTYTIEDNLLPSDKNLILSCKKCKCRIKIDKNDEQQRKDSKIGVGVKKWAELKDSSSKTEQSPNDLKNQILKGIKNLPPMPHVVIKAQQLMVDPHSSAKQVAGVIESDQAIATKVLKMANSAYYGMSGKVSSLQHATIVLGYQTLGEIITTASFSGFLGGKLPGYGYESKALWKHSLSVALASKMIAAKKNHSLVNEAYTAGLIHDVGKVVLDSHILAKKDQINEYMEEEEKTFFDAERHFFGFDHAEIASEICQKWNIPEKITLGIKCHHQPSISKGDELSYILHIADYIATMGGIGYDDDDALYRPEDGAIDFLGLKQDSVREIMLNVMESVNKI